MLISLMRMLGGNTIMKFILLYARLKIGKKKADKSDGEKGGRKERSSVQRVWKFRISQSFFEKLKET